MKREIIKGEHLAFAYCALIRGYYYDPISTVAATRIEEREGNALVSLSIPQEDGSHRTLYILLPKTVEVETVAAPKQQEVVYV